MFKGVKVFFTIKKKKSPKKKSPSPSTKRAINIEKKFKKLLNQGYAINKARSWSRL